MSNLRQPCPYCRRPLELPTSSIGRLAKCPACDATFTVANPEPTSPYAPSAHPPSPVRTVENFEIVELAIEDVVTPAWNIFLQRWTPLVLSMLIVLGIGMVLMIVLAVVLVGLAASGSKIAMVLGVIAMLPLSFFASTYAWVGMTRVALAVARNEMEPLAQMYSPPHLVWRMLGVSLIIGAASLAVLAVLVVGMGGIAFAVGGQQAAPLGIFAAISILIVAFFIAQILLWPLPFIISDDQSTAMGAIRISMAISMQNKLPSFLLILIKMVLSMIGGAMCYVGLLATQPLTLLLFTVAYLLMTRQKIADPSEYEVT